MEINNKHIVLIFLIIIIGVFIYNYDVYVIPKNESLCKPIYITKRELSPEIRGELNKTESEILKEAFGNLSENGYMESFGNISSESNSYNVPSKSFSSFTVNSMTNKDKIKVIDSVIKILSYIPTNYSEVEIKQMVEYFSMIYETSPDIETYYKNVSMSTKIKEEPYNSKYSHLLLFLIGKFDNDYANCINLQESDEKCAINNLVTDIIEKSTTNEIINQESKSNYLSSENTTKPNIILPKNNKSSLNDYIDNNNNFVSKEITNENKKSNCNGTKCTYKCDSSYSNAISYLDKELKPLEGFGNIQGNYANF